MKKRSAFFIFICCAGMLAGAGQWVMYKQGLPFFSAAWTISFFLLLPVVFTLPNVVKKHLPQLLTRLLAVVGGYWLIFFYYSLYLLIFYFILYAAAGILQLNSFWPAFSPVLSSAGFTFIILLIIRGSWNAFHPTCREIVISTGKPLKRSLTIAFVSDIHLGAILGTSFARKLSDRINMHEPDVVLFGGDIIDGNLEFVIKEGSWQEFRSIRAPLGKYAVYGNHDYFGGDPAKERELFSAAGISFLKDQSVILTDSLKITGLDDYLYHPSLIKPVSDNGFFQILMEHEPYQIAAAAAANYDLYLAGHTHAGQFYPNRLITRKIYALDYGCRLFNEMTAVVSNGYGFWGTPVRLGPPPEIVLIQLQKI